MAQNHTTTAATIGFGSELWRAADALRSNMDTSTTARSRYWATRRCGRSPRSWCRRCATV